MANQLGFTQGVALDERDAPACDDSSLRSIVAREGAELAAVLRSKGWHARAGWKTLDADGNAVWFVRFECPGGAESR